VLAYLEPGGFYQLFNELMIHRRWPLWLFRPVFSTSMINRVAYAVSKQPVDGRFDAHEHFSMRQIWRELGILENAAEHSMLRAAFAEFTERLFGGFALRYGRSRWAIKEPTYLYSHIDEIHAIHPNMKFVHIVRDGRDVVASIMRQPWACRRPTRFGYALRLWVGELHRGDAIAAKIPPESLLRLRLEDFHSNPDYLRLLCEFIQEEYHPEMVRYFRSRVSASQTHHGRWKKDLTRRQISQIESVGGTILERHGYLN
jgi:hypothetical protein